MPLAATDPFGNRNVASGGFTTPVLPAKPLGSQITSGISDIVGLFQNMGQQGVRRAQAGYYGAETDRAKAEAYKAQSEGEAKAAAIARQQTKDRDFQEGERQYQTVINAGGSPVDAARAREAIIAPYYADEHGAAGITAEGANSAMLSGVDPTGSGAPPTPIQRAARNVAAGYDATAGHALQGPEGSTQLTYDDSINALAADEQRKRDAEVQQSKDRRFATSTESGDRRFATGVESGDRRFATTTEAATSNANNYRTTYAEAYGKSLHDIREAGGDARLPGGGAPLNKASGAGDQTQVITGPKGQVLQTRTITRTPPPAARAVPGLPQGPAYPQGPAGPSLQPAPAMAKPNMSDAAKAPTRWPRRAEAPTQKAQIARRAERLEH